MASPQMQTPPLLSRRSSGAKSLALDLSDLPGLITPSPPSNTLLITNLDHPIIFEPHNLQTIRDLISQHVPLYSFSPLKSFHRIIISFFDIDSATAMKQTLDRQVIFDCPIRVYFGAQVDISPADQHLRAPQADKQFFISPPPSPPHGWEMRNEGPPNKDVHADDLALALSRLHAQSAAKDVRDREMGDMGYNAVPNRNRSGSITVVYHPEHHGSNPALPAISVEDTSESESPENLSPMEGVTQEPILHTSRPPVELMEQ